MSENLEILPEINHFEPPHPSAKRKFKKPLIFIGILIWVIAFCIVSYHCYESDEWSKEIERAKFLHSLANVDKNIDNLQNEMVGDGLPISSSSTGRTAAVLFQQISQFDNGKGKTNSKEFKKLKEQLSKLESNKQKLAITKNHEQKEENFFNTTTDKMSVDEVAGSPLKNYNLGEIRSIFSVNLCLDASEVDGAGVILYECHGEGGNQFWEINEQGEIRKGVVCLDYFGGPHYLFQCHGGGGNQKWIYETKDQLIQQPISGYCLTVIEGTKLAMKPCNDSLKEQRWWWRKGIYKKSNNEL